MSELIEQLYSQIDALRHELKSGRTVLAAIIKRYGTNNELTLSDADLESISPNDYLLVKLPVIDRKTTFKLVER